MPQVSSVSSLVGVQTEQEIYSSLIVANRNKYATTLSDLRSKLYLMAKKRSWIQNTYKETQRTLLNIFNSFAVINSENQVIEVRCRVASPERTIGNLFKEDNFVLPLITVGSSNTEGDDDRRKYNPLLVQEKYWDPNRRRAVRVLSFTPKPINILYDINIWAMYKEDLDQLMEQIFQIFNPELVVSTPNNTYTRAFIDSETDNSEVIVADTRDRVLRKTITIEVQTYIQSPKFLYTSTGKIEEINSEIELYKF